MPEQEILDAYNKAAEGETSGTPMDSAPAPTGQNPATTPQEFLEYFVGASQSKLPLTSEFSFKHGGEQVRVPAAKLLNSYRAAATLEGKLKEQEGKFSTTQKEFETLKANATSLEEYKALQAWSQDLETKDPAAFKHLIGTIEAIKGGTWQGDNPAVSSMSKTIAELTNKLNGMETWKSDWEKQQQETQVAKDQEEVLAEKNTLQKELKEKGYNVNLDEADELGVTLFHKIIKFGLDEGLTKDFKTPAMVYLKDTLLDQAKGLGREEAMKGFKGDVKAGVLSRSSQPFNGQSKVDPRKMGDRETLDAAIAEYNRLTG